MAPTAGRAIMKGSSSIKQRKTSGGIRKKPSSGSTSKKWTSSRPIRSATVAQPPALISHDLCDDFDANVEALRQYSQVFPMTGRERAWSQPSRRRQSHSSHMLRRPGAPLAASGRAETATRITLTPGGSPANSLNLLSK